MKAMMDTMNLAPLKARWQALGQREQMMVAAAALVVGLALAWLVALGPALSTLRASETQRRSLDAQLQRMRGLQAQAQALQSQPKQGYDEAVRRLELSVRERLGTTARMVIAGDRVTLTLSGTAADALAQWLTQARVNARALPSEAHLMRNSGGLWEGTVVLTLPPR
ncbi:MAG TPA: type II secretion system protein GspM [Ramlibacter sp.]|nr:type II secretion system protein GspM [Ramlibacter sp.]